MHNGTLTRDGAKEEPCRGLEEVRLTGDGLDEEEEPWRGLEEVRQEEKA